MRQGPSLQWIEYSQGAVGVGYQQVQHKADPQEWPFKLPILNANGLNGNGSHTYTGELFGADD